MDKEMIVTALRCDLLRTDCYGCSYYICDNLRFCCDHLRLNCDAAELIEAQAAEIERVAAERDAAVESWRGFCVKCNWRGKQYLSDGKMDDRCKTCLENNKCNWKWRGPQGAGEGGNG